MISLYHIATRVQACAQHRRRKPRHGSSPENLRSCPYTTAAEAIIEKQKEVILCFLKIGFRVPGDMEDRCAWPARNKPVTFS
jgi:hypothetical protein